MEPKEANSIVGQVFRKVRALHWEKIVKAIYKNV